MKLSMKRLVFSSLLLVLVLAHCAKPPRQPEPVPPAPEGFPVVQEEEAPPPPEATPPPEPQPQPYIHEVRWPGETLCHIARWYTGSSNNWKKIAAANPGLNPLRIDIGHRILIPEELLKERKPMPRHYVLKTPKRRPPNSNSKPSKSPGQEKLFGPVELLSPPGASEKDELYGPVELLQTPAHSQPSPTGR
jgi:hypothetical protein